MYEPVIQRIRELGSPGLIMSGSKEEGVLLGDVKCAPQPPGRGNLVSRRAADVVDPGRLAATEPRRCVIVCG